MIQTSLADLMPGRGVSVDPSKFLEERFDLFSVPAYDSLQPDSALGKEIGSSKQVVQPGDVLLSKIVPHIRRAWIVPEATGRRQIGSSEWIIFRGKQFEPRYLRHVLLSDQFNAKLMQTVSGVGGSLLRARPTSVAKLKIPLPPIDEQRRIADILDQAEELRAKRRAAIALLDQLPQAIFLEMFGDPATNPMGWPIMYIRDLLASASYGTSGKACDDGSWPILRMGNITADGHLDLSNLKYIGLKPTEIPKYTVEKGDILFNRTNSVDLVGKTALYNLDRSMAFAGYLVRLRLNSKAIPEFLAVFMNLDYTKEVLRGMAKSIVGMANINAKEVQTIRLPVPDTHLQRQYAGRIEVINRAKAAHESDLAKLDALFASLQSLVFETRPGSGKQETRV